MSVTYVIVSKADPRDKEAPKKYYAQAKSRSEFTFRMLCKEIADGSTTVSDTDVMAVLNDLVKILTRHLSNGEIVRLSDFASLQVTLGSEGTETEEEFNSSRIRDKKVAFRPGPNLREMLNNLKFEKLK
jgi:DNA-binding protein, histone-like, putative